MASRTLSSLQNDAQTKVIYRGPFTWLTVFGVLFCILEYKHFTDNHFCLRRSNGPLYDAPDKCYAGDLQSFGATLEGVKRTADLVSTYASFFNPSIATHKLRAFHYCGVSPASAHPLQLLVHASG